MKGFLLDENIPERLTFHPSLPVVVARVALGSGAPDNALWEYAKESEYVIVSKDTDFSDRILSDNPPPWVIHLRFGNMQRRDFHQLLEKTWGRIEALIVEHKMVCVYEDRIEAIK